MAKRAESIQADVEEVELPKGDETRGWRKHWRHGMWGAVQYWACGSRANVIKMLVDLAKDFGVAPDVAEELRPDQREVCGQNDGPNQCALMTLVACCY